MRDVKMTEGSFAGLGGRGLIFEGCRRPQWQREEWRISIVISRGSGSSSAPRTSGNAFQIMLHTSVAAYSYIGLSKTWRMCFKSRWRSSASTSHDVTSH